LRSVAIGTKNYLFVGSQTGGRAATIACTLIETAKLNGIDPQAWLADTLARIPDGKITRVDELLPWNAAKEGGQAGRLPTSRRDSAIMCLRASPSSSASFAMAAFNIAITAELLFI
jgi:hypothetical protein